MEKKETVIWIVPKGQSDQFAMWADTVPHSVRVESETDKAWIGYPASNPNVTVPLTYPKFAWETL